MGVLTEVFNPLTVMQSSQAASSKEAGEMKRPLLTDKLSVELRIQIYEYCFAGFKNEYRLTRRRTDAQTNVDDGFRPQV